MFFKLAWQERSFRYAKRQMEMILNGRKWAWGESDRMNASNGWTEMNEFLPMLTVYLHCTLSPKSWCTQRRFPDFFSCSSPGLDRCKAGVLCSLQDAKWCARPDARPSRAPCTSLVHCFQARLSSASACDRTESKICLNGDLFCESIFSVNSNKVRSFDFKIVKV